MYAPFLDNRYMVETTYVKYIYRRDYHLKLCTYWWYVMTSREGQKERKTHGGRLWSFMPDDTRLLTTTKPRRIKSESVAQPHAVSCMTTIAEPDIIFGVNLCGGFLCVTDHRKYSCTSRLHKMALD